jgi:hypothetical protein
MPYVCIAEDVYNFPIFALHWRFSVRSVETLHNVQTAWLTACNHLNEHVAWIPQFPFQTTEQGQRSGNVYPRNAPCSEFMECQQNMLVSFQNGIRIAV